MKSKSKARKGAGAGRTKAAAELAVRAWAGALVAKLEGLSGAVRAVNQRARGTDAAADLLGRVLDRERLEGIAHDLHRLTEEVAGLIRGDANAELPDVLAALGGVRLFVPAG